MDDAPRLRIGLAQATLSWQDPEANRAHLQALLEAGVQSADIIVMPETFTTGFLGDGEAAGEGMDGPTVAWMQELAAAFSCVITGSAVILTPEGRMNRLLWVEPCGMVRHYDKKHLFSFAGEHRRFAAGNQRVVFDYRGWRIFPQICYDIRFPVWCRNRGDYDLMLVVANWPKPRIDAWSALLKARAIENQAYVVAVNRVGEDGKGNEYSGQSVVRDALGASILRLDDGEQYAEAEISRPALRAVREQLPFQDDADVFRLD